MQLDHLAPCPHSSPRLARMLDACRLLQAGFDTQVPTMWVIEGVIYYLEQDAAQALLLVRAKVMVTGA